MTDLDRLDVLELDFDDIRFGGGVGTSDYWRGWNDGINKAEEYLTENDLPLATIRSLVAAVRERDELRAAGIAALEEFYGFTYESWPDDLALLLAEPVPLDVERLARAMHEWRGIGEFNASGCQCREHAADIAAEYARLTDPKGVTDGE